MAIGRSAVHIHGRDPLTAAMRINLVALSTVRWLEMFANRYSLPVDSFSDYSTENCPKNLCQCVIASRARPRTQTKKKRKEENEEEKFVIKRTVNVSSSIQFSISRFSAEHSIKNSLIFARPKSSIELTFSFCRKMKNRCTHELFLCREFLWIYGSVNSVNVAHTQKLAIDGVKYVLLHVEDMAGRPDDGQDAAQSHTETPNAEFPTSATRPKSAHCTQYFMDGFYFAGACSLFNKIKWRKEKVKGKGKKKKRKEKYLRF